MVGEENGEIGWGPSVRRHAGRARVWDSPAWVGQLAKVSVIIFACQRDSSNLYKEQSNLGSH